MSSLDPPRIAYAAANSQLYILFDGSATHRVSLTAEQLVSEFLASNPTKAMAILDLDGCAWVDSTFAGWMIRLQQRVARIGGRVVISNCCDNCLSSLEVMGLKSLFEFQHVSAPPELHRIACPEEGANADTLDFMADAHEHLADVSPDNERVFARIAAELRRELKQHKV